MRICTRRSCHWLSGKNKEDGETSREDSYGRGHEPSPALRLHNMSGVLRPYNDFTESMLGSSFSLIPIITLKYPEQPIHYGISCENGYRFGSLPSLPYLRLTNWSG